MTNNFNISLVALKDIKGGPISEDVFAKFKEVSDLEDDNFIVLYSGILLLVKKILQHPVNTIKKDLLCTELTELR